jgi:hypothetical protein
MAGWRVKPEEISGRVLSLAIPKGSKTAAQRAAIEAAKARAQAFDVELMVTSSSVPTLSAAVMISY